MSTLQHGAFLLQEFLGTSIQVQTFQNIATPDHVQLQ